MLNRIKKWKFIENVFSKNKKEFEKIDSLIKKTTKESNLISRSVDNLNKKYEDLKKSINNVADQLSHLKTHNDCIENTQLRDVLLISKNITNNIELYNGRLSEIEKLVNR